MIENLTTQLKHLSLLVPVEFFVLLGGFLEEIIAPIPSPLIMTLAGSLLYMQQKGMPALIFISLLAAIGKTFGSWLLYIASDKAEDLIMEKFGKWLGVTHKDIESIGKHFDNTWKDDLLLIILRAFPLIPGAPVAVVCGIIKLNPKTYIRSTFIGTFIRSLLFGFIGFGGLAKYQVIIDGINALESAGKLILILGTLGLGLWLYYLRKHGGVQKWIQKHIKK